MKKTILLFCFIILGFSTAFAQHKGGKNCLSENKKKELQEFKINFLSDEMDLKDDQKKRFEELYTQMENERRSLIRKKKDIERKLSDSKNATDADYEKANKEILEIKTLMAEIEKKYDEKFSQFLTKKQLFQLKQAEDKFNQKIRGCIDKKRKEKKN